MLNICVGLPKQCLMLNGYAIMLRNPVILSMKHVNLSVNVLNAWFVTVAITFFLSVYAFGVRFKIVA